MSDSDAVNSASRAWVRREQRAGRRPARPIILLGLAGTVLAIAQAFCAADVLTGVAVVPALAGFAILAMLRAAVGYGADRTAFAAGASARRRLRTDTLTRLLNARPLLARTRHSAELTAVIVDRIEALDGLFSRYIPAAALAVVGTAGRRRRRRLPRSRGRDDPRADRPVRSACDGVGGPRRGSGFARPVSGDDPTAIPLPRPHPRHRDDRDARPRRG